MTENKKTYNLYLSSTDRISGTHNNPTFNVNWDTFLPKNKYFSVNFSFISAGGIYADCVIASQSLYNSAIKINCNMQDTHFSTDTSSQSTTMNLGYAGIDCAYVVTGGFTKGNSYIVPYLSNPSKVVIRPQNTQLQFWIYNLSALMNNITFPASTTGFNPANALYNNYLQVECAPNAGNYTLSTDMKPWSMIISFIEIDDAF